MQIVLDEHILRRLRSAGVTTFLQAGALLPEKCEFEPPCSLKWMSVQHSLTMGAFSYAVSGFYFGCRIGRYCSFGENIQIGRHPHPFHWFSSSPYFYTEYQQVLDQPLPTGEALTPTKDFIRQSAPVHAKMTNIGHDVWIGHGAFILPGISISTGAAVAAYSVVTKDVPPYALVAGNPARIIRYRFDSATIENLLESSWWEYAPWQLKGCKVDIINAFIDYIEGLKSRSVATYKPELFLLSKEFG